MRLPSTDLAAPLLTWFERERRDLPWRKEPRDPYRVWVSEVMLQQTRVEVVVPYFERFVARFPTLRALAGAPLDEVLARWSGLGYYARARNLHKAAQATAPLGFALPRTAAELAQLPGFGPYTSAAVASLAFDEQVALVDGNVARVLARVLRLQGDPARARTLAWERAAALLPPGRAGEFNEALMELGALICTPRAPACADCPLEKQCRARLHGDPERFPAPKQKKARPQLTWAAAALFRGEQILLQRRAAGQLFEGLWDLPSLPVQPGGSARTAARAAARACGHRGPLAEVAEVNQTLTHREVRVLIFRGEMPSAGSAPPALRWTRASELGGLGLSSLARKSLRGCGLIDT